MDNNKEFYKTLLNNLSEKKEESYVNRVLLIDSMNTFIRSFSAVNYLNQNGHHIGGLVGSLISVGYAIKTIRPTKVILVFDGKGSTNNKKNLYPDYKLNRNVSRITNWDIFVNKEEEVESMQTQLTRLITYFQQLPVSLISIDKTEADDVIAILSQEITKNGKDEAYIMSADKDFLQLVDDKTTVYSPTKKKFYTPKEVKEEYNVLSHNFIHYKALLGDSSDNIPGISGLGPKKLLKLFPELLEQNISYDFIKEKSLKNLNENKLYSSVLERDKQLEINYKLMDLKNIVIHPDDYKTIIDCLNNPSNEYNKYKFLSYYNNDLLGHSIKNVEFWVDDCFKYLNNNK